MNRATITDAHKVLLLRDAASAAGVSERTLRSKMEEKGFRTVALSARRVGVLQSDYEAFLKSCQA